MAGPFGLRRSVSLPVPMFPVDDFPAFDLGSISRNIQWMGTGTYIQKEFQPIAIKANVVSITNFCTVIAEM